MVTKMSSSDIKNKYPDFFKMVKFWTEIIAIRGDDMYARGMLEGYAEAMIHTGTFKHPREFINYMQKIANRRYGNGKQG